MVSNKYVSIISYEQQSKTMLSPTMLDEAKVCAQEVFVLVLGVRVLALMLVLVLVFFGVVAVNLSRSVVFLRCRVAGSSVACALLVSSLTGVPLHNRPADG